MANLVKYILFDLDGWIFALGDHYWMHISVVNDYVCPVITVVRRDGGLQGNKPLWYIQVFNEILDQVLTYPLFRC